MSMKMTSWNYTGKTEFLVTVDHYVALGHRASQATAAAPGQTVVINNRRILRAGTIWRDNDGKAIGLVADDYDLTDGDKQIAVVVHGFASRAKLPSAPSYADEIAMKDIHFVDGTEPEEAVSDYPEYFVVDIPTDAHGSVAVQSGSHRVVVKGGSFAFKVTASEGYHVSAVAANGSALTPSTAGVYTIADIDADQTISVTIEQD